MSNQLTVSEELSPASNIATPTTLLEMAINKGADIDQLEKLMQLQERYDAKQAKSAFLEAMSKFQSDVPTILKAKDGHNYKYAPLADIVQQIKSTLKDCGLSYRFEQSHIEGIDVTCIVSHIGGHSERNTMAAPADTSGSKNAVQAIGSTVQYLQRYTLIGALGITTADSDMDGRLPFEGLSNEQIKRLDEKIVESGTNKAKFLQWKKVDSLDQIRANDYQQCVFQLDNAMKARAKNDNS